MKTNKAYQFWSFCGLFRWSVIDDSCTSFVQGPNESLISLEDILYQGSVFAVHFENILDKLLSHLKQKKTKYKQKELCWVIRYQ